MKDVEKGLEKGMLTHILWKLNIFCQADFKHRSAQSEKGLRKVSVKKVK